MEILLHYSNQNEAEKHIKLLFNSQHNIYQQFYLQTVSFVTKQSTSAIGVTNIKSFTYKLCHLLQRGLVVQSVSQISRVLPTNCVTCYKWVICV